LIDGLVRLMSSPDDLAGPVNIGNPTEVTIGELANRIVAMTASRSQVVYRPLPADDPLQRCPDIALAKSTLGWEPKVPLAEGLAKTIDYFREQKAGT
jgi:UDP-glucuronate decarboxylase